MSEQDKKSPQNSLAEKDLSDVKYSLVNEAENKNSSLASNVESQHKLQLNSFKRNCRESLRKPAY